jgi:hypothetical protein
MNKIVCYCSESVREIYSQRGPFTFKKHEDSSIPSQKLEKRNIVQIADKTYYLGQWRRGTEIKEGRGILVKDGSIYEGYWKNDMENGVGRFINQSGDVYQG